MQLKQQILLLAASASCPVTVSKQHKPFSRHLSSNLYQLSCPVLIYVLFVTCKRSSGIILVIWLSFLSEFYTHSTYNNNSEFKPNISKYFRHACKLISTKILNLQVSGNFYVNQQQSAVML